LERENKLDVILHLFITSLLINLINFIKLKEEINIPKGKVPYKRGYTHGRERGREETVICSMCGSKVPRWKCITQRRGFRITDPAILKEVGRGNIHTSSEKQYICPKCARFHNIVKKR